MLLRTVIVCIFETGVFGSRRESNVHSNHKLTK